MSLFFVFIGIKETMLTRLEMSTLLCMADRQHSQLMDLMPEKSGMTGHGKELFDPTLKEVSITCYGVSHRMITCRGWGL